MEAFVHPTVRRQPMNRRRTLSHTPSPPPSYDEAVDISSWNQPKPNWFFRLAFKLLGSRKFSYKFGNLTVRSSAENYWRFRKWFKAERKKSSELLHSIAALERLKKDNVRAEIVISSKGPDESPGIEIAPQKNRKGETITRITIHFDPGKLAQSKELFIHPTPPQKSDAQISRDPEQASHPKTAPQIEYPVSSRFPAHGNTPAAKLHQTARSR